jgi:hypothetical protein
VLALVRRLLSLDLHMTLRLGLGLALAFDQRGLRAQQPFELRLRDVAEIEQDVAQALGRAHVVLGAQGL